MSAGKSLLWSASIIEKDSRSLSSSVDDAQISILVSKGKPRYSNRCIECEPFF